MTKSSGGDLFHGSLAARQPRSVVVGCQIAHQRGGPVSLLENRKRLFEKRRLARTGTGNQAYDENTFLQKTLPQPASSLVVTLQHILPNFHDAGRRYHSVNSNPETCSSRPCSTSDAGVPHSAHRNDCREQTGRSALHCEQ